MKTQIKKKRQCRPILLGAVAATAGMMWGSVSALQATTVTWDVGSGNWDTTATNWAAGTYADGDNVVFGTGSFGNATVNVDAGAVAPLSLSVTNNATAYTFTGSAINVSGTSAIDSTLSVGDAMTLTGAVTFFQPTSSVTSSAAVNINAGGSVTLAQAAGGTVTQSENSVYSGNLIVENAVRLNFNTGFKITGSATNGGSYVNGQATISGTGQVQVQANGTIFTNQSSYLAGTVNVPISLNSLGSGNTKLDVTQALSSGNGGANGVGTFTTVIGGTTSHNSNFPNSNLIIGGAISGNSDVEIANALAGGGSGNLTLNNQNTWTGTTEFNFGKATLYNGVNNALPTSTDVIYDTNSGVSTDSGTWDLNGHNQTISSISTVTSTSTAASQLVITNNGTSNSVLTIGGNNTPFYSFGAQMHDGTNGGTLALVRSGSGTMVITGAATNTTFTGGTTVNGGTLQVDGGLTVTGNITVGGSAASGSPTFSGTGTAGLVTVNGAGGGAAGILAPGDGGQVGTLSVATLTMQSGSILNVAFASDASSNSMVDVANSGGLALNTVGVDLYIAGTTNPFDTPGVYDLLDYSGTLGGTGTNGLSVLDPQAGFDYQFSTSGGSDVVLTITAVPEPAMGGLFLLGGAALLRRRKRRQAKA